MASILYRGAATPTATNISGSANRSLTNLEIDQNFYALDRDKFEKSGGTITGDTTVNANLIISGNLTINGTTTTVNSTAISIDDKNIELGSVSTPSDVLADGGGITLKGTTDKTINWINSTSSWTSSENIALASGKNLRLLGNSGSGYSIISAASINTDAILTLPNTSGTIALTSNINDTLESVTTRGASTSSSINFNNRIFISDGSAINPSIAFNSDSSKDTGLYWGGDGRINFASNGSYAGHITNGDLTMAGTVTALSDERLKTNWKDLPNDFVRQLAGVKCGTYDRVDGYKLTQVGVSGQSLQEILPSAVLEGKYLSVSYGNAALVSAIQLAKAVLDITKSIESLSSKIENLENQINNRG